MSNRTPLLAPPLGLRVLVVEDQYDCAETTAQLLSLWGHAPEVASDGRTALTAAGRSGPDVVLLDLHLPDISGLEVARQLRMLPLSKPPFVVAVTASADDSDHRASREAGIDLHLVKPCDPNQLQRLLRRVQSFLREE